MQVPTKHTFLSKTFWLGVAVAAIPFLDSVVDLIDPTTEHYSIIVAIVGGLIILLRQLTRQPVSITGKETKYIDNPKGDII